MKIVAVAKPAGGAEAIRRRPSHPVELAAGANARTDPAGNAVKRLVFEDPAKPVSAAESIFGSDERTRIVDTKVAPWRMVCQLEITGPEGSTVGTGWLAGPRTIITAGHCVFHKSDLGGWATSITVTPGMQDGDAPFGSFVATRVESITPWVDDENPDFDMGVIHIDPVAGQPDPGDALGFFGVAALPDDALLGRMVNVSGYPGDKIDAQNRIGTQQWFARNKVSRVTARRIFYAVDTMPGQSGGPAYMIDAPGAAPKVVGIHAYGSGGTPASLGIEANSAPRLIPEVVEQIRAWVAAS